MKAFEVSKRIARVCMACALASAPFCQAAVSCEGDMGVFGMHTGNPVIPAYLADASVMYDGRTDMFYAYGTNDGGGGENVYPTQMWYSKDCRQWHNKPLNLPQSWIDESGKKALWAPSMIYYPVTGKYYLMYGIDCKTYVGMSDSPSGPWVDANAVAPGKMLYQGYDAQFFLDDDNTMYIVTDNGFFKIMKLKFDDDGKVRIDNTDSRFTQTDSNGNIGEYHYKSVEGIRNMFEASFIYKRNGLYYLMWSFEGSENYNVRYAVSENLTGPYRGLNGSMDIPILKRDDYNNILGPGHHSVFDYGGKTYIVYHRQHYPFIDSKRQTCIEEMTFAPDGSINPVIPTHRGVEVVKNATRSEKRNLASGKPTMVSDARKYASSFHNPRFRTTDIDFRFTGNFAVDDNYGTRWDAGVGAVNPWIIIDLEKDRTFSEVETIFEYTNRTYRYKVEYLSGKEAKSLDEASVSDSWRMFADRTADGAPQSPVTDSLAAPVKGRFVRLTITYGDVPETSDGADMENATNGWSIFEIRVS